MLGQEIKSPLADFTPTTFLSHICLKIGTRLDIFTIRFMIESEILSLFEDVGKCNEVHAVSFCCNLLLEMWLLTDHYS